MEIFWFILSNILKKVRRFLSSFIDLGMFLFFAPILGVLQFIGDFYLMLISGLFLYRLLLAIFNYCGKRTPGQFICRVRLIPVNDKNLFIRMVLRVCVWMFYAIAISYWCFLIANPYLDEQTYSAFIMKIQHPYLLYVYFAAGVILNLDMLYMFCNHSHQYLHDRLLGFAFQMD